MIFFFFTKDDVSDLCNLIYFHTKTSESWYMVYMNYFVGNEQYNISFSTIISICTPLALQRTFSCLICSTTVIDYLLTLKENLLTTLYIYYYAKYFGKINPFLIGQNLLFKKDIKQCWTSAHCQ